MIWFRPKGLDDPTISKVAETLKAEGLAILPTDTVYGLSANALSVNAVSKVFQAKQRAFGKPLIVIAANQDTAKSLAAEWPETAEELSRKYWPGPLSLIVRAADHIPPLVTANTNKVAIRVPNNPLTLRILELAKVPLVSTSANLSGDASPKTAAESLELALSSPHIEWLVDGGVGGSIESTVLDVTANPPMVLRQGPIQI